MSFDLFVVPLPDSTWSETDRQKIIEILYRDVGPKAELWNVTYADGSGAREISGLCDEDNEEDLTSGLCFRRFGGRTFTDRLYEIADRLDAMVFWPGDAPMVAVTRPDLFERLPVELAPTDKVIVRDADDLMAQICK